MQKSTQLSPVLPDKQNSDETAADNNEGFVRQLQAFLAGLRQLAEEEDLDWASLVVRAGLDDLEVAT